MRNHFIRYTTGWIPLSVMVLLLLALVASHSGTPGPLASGSRLETGLDFDVSIDVEPLRILDRDATRQPQRGRGN